MNPLVLHIQYLLSRRKSISINGLGKFIVTYSPAEFDKKTRRLSSPAYDVKFVNDLFTQDSYICESYMRKLSIRKEEAKKKIRRDLIRLISDMAAGKDVEIGDFGTMGIESSGKVFFKPEEMKLDFVY